MDIHIYHHFEKNCDETDILHRILHGIGEIKQGNENIMSKVTDFATKEQGDIDALNAKLDAIASGVIALEAKITDLQNTVTGLTPEEQAALDAVATASDALVTKANAIDTTAPAPPTA